MLAFVTLAIKDLDAAAAASNPFIFILEQALGSGFGRAVLWVVTIAMWFCGLSCVTSTSRMIFAFARDNGMPRSDLWAKVSRTYRTPAAAVWLSALLTFLLPSLVIGLVELSKRLRFESPYDFTQLYPAVVGISTIGLYLSYGIPLMLKLRAIRHGLWSTRANGPWSLGNWSVPVNLVALAWIGFITVLFVLPPNTLTGWIFGGTLVALMVLYFVTARGRFQGPLPQAKSQSELLRLEAELEH
jgi:amino acid transporter